MEKYIPRPVEIKEGRRVIITASCQDCNWRSSLPTTILRLAKDSGLLQDYSLEHEKKYDHRVDFKVEGCMEATIKPIMKEPFSVPASIYSLGKK